MAVLLLVLPHSGISAQEGVNFSSMFTSGAPSGNIQISYEEAIWEQESSGLYHLLLHKPGVSKIQGSFTLEQVPSKMYIQINHRTSTIQDVTQKPTYAVYVNGKRCAAMELSFDLYTTLRYEMKSQCRPGQNQFSIDLDPAARTSLWVRQIDISPVVSFVEQAREGKKSENFLMLLPLYLAYFFLFAITISYLLFVIMWRNSINPQVATFLALFVCGIGFMILPFLIFGLTLYTALASFIGLIVGIVWIVSLHK
jgi:hypothetical protein